MTRKTFYIFLLLTVLFLSSIPQASAQSAQTTATSCSDSLHYVSGGDFYVGDVTPTNANGPVVVFVHGYISSHITWNLLNDAVRDACNNGFRVAAVDLNPIGSIWANGSNLTNKLWAIAGYYKVPKVNVMAHSKGGLDTQTAIVHYGAYPVVDTYIAFGSPYGGTDLADHACSWYGSALWQCNDATWSMRTSYMSYVRSITDGRSENNGVRAYLVRGTQCDWYNPACLMISGASDGVVPAWSVWANARGTRLADRSDLHHLEVHHTQEYGSWIFSYLGRRGSTGTLSARQDDTTTTPDVAPMGEPTRHIAQSNYTLRGGALGNSVAEQIMVEGGLDAVTFSLISNSSVKVTVVSPSGVTYQTSAHPAAPGEILQGTTYAVRVETPEAGQWQVLGTPERRSGKGGGGFMLYTFYEGGVTVELDTDLAQVYKPGEQLPLTVRTNGQASRTRVFASLQTRDNHRVAGTNGELNGRALALPRQGGSYTLDLTVTGIAADGTPFERTLVTSLAVGDGGMADERAEGGVSER